MYCYNIIPLCMIYMTDIPLKVICFIWLCLANCMNTWDNLIRKGWTGPNRCSLYKNGEELVNHLFSTCSFTHHIFNYLSRILDRSMDWNEPSFEDNMDTWFRNEKELLHLPLLTTWHMWLTRNRVILDDLNPDANVICHSILQQL